MMYYFRLRFEDEVHTLALVSLYSPPNPELLKQSHQVVYSCRAPEDGIFQLIDIKAIQSVVAMVPYFKVLPNGEIFTPENEYFMIEKPGVELAQYRGVQDDDDEYDEHNSGE